MDAAPQVLALKPLAAPANQFPKLLSDHLQLTGIVIVPFSWEALGRAKYDLVLFHWPTEFFRPSSRRKSLALLTRMVFDKLRHGTRFVWLVHNLEPHEEGASRRSALTARLFFAVLDGTIFLSRHSRDELHRVYPSTRSLRSLVTAHGRYPEAATAPSPFDALASRGRLLFFGLVRPYKNVERLVAEARRVTASPFSLTVLGACFDAALAERIRAQAGDDPRIRIDLRRDHIPDAELEAEIDAHDGVVLPYRRILNSGVALHALGRNKPILAPAMGSLPELRDAAGHQWVQLFDGEISAEKIDRFLAGIAGIAHPAPDLSAFAWDRIGSEVSNFLARLLRR